MKIGVVILPDDRWASTRERWVRAEALGFAHAWTYDHLTWRDMRDGPWFAAIPTLTAAALATTTLRIGTLVTSPNFRHPVPLAKELMTLDDLSGGRLQIGIGAGGDGWDASALGQADWTPQERADHFEEFIALLDRLLVQPETNHHGRFYSANDARALPGCVQQPRPPFIVAGGGPRGMKLAVEHGAGWVAVDGRDATPAKLARLREACAAAGRDPGTLRTMALLGFSETPMASLEAFRDCVGRYTEWGFSDAIVHWPRAAEPFAARPKILDEIADEVAAANRSDT